MKLKLDLHPIYNDTSMIEAELRRIIDEAVTKRATEVEIIPGKGSGALKKTVLRFLDRPEVKARYHRLEKDGDNWGRLFVHFRPPAVFGVASAPVPEEASLYLCFCCDAPVSIVVEDVTDASITRLVECPACASPNRLHLRRDRSGVVRVRAENGYD